MLTRCDYSIVEMDSSTYKQCKKLLKALKLKKSKALYFLEPVDYKELGLDDYPEVIPEPMDLGTVQVLARVVGGFSYSFRIASITVAASSYTGATDGRCRGSPGAHAWDACSVVSQLSRLPMWLALHVARSPCSEPVTHVTPLDSFDWIRTSAMKPNDYK